MEAPQSPDELEIEPLIKAHNRKDFRCGNEHLDSYIQMFARQNMEYGFGRTYVAVKPGERRVWAYYTLAASQVDSSHLPTAKGCPRFISTVLMARLAVDSQIARNGVGQKLMGHAFQMSIEAAERVGIHAMFVEAKDSNAANYYTRYGFNALMDSPLHLFMPIKRIVAALNE